MSENSHGRVADATGLLPPAEPRCGSGHSPCDPSRGPAPGDLNYRSEWEASREISHEEAREIASRLIASHFRRTDCETARVGIPARPDYDDDLLICSYIKQQSRRGTSAPVPPDRVGEEDGRGKLREHIEETDNLLHELIATTQGAIRDGVERAHFLIHEIAHAVLSGSAASIPRASAEMALMYLRTGFVTCSRCGYEETTEHLDAAYELNAALSGQGNGCGWHPISTAPKDGSLVLLWSSIVMRVGWWFEDDEVWRVGGDTILRAPTHWMPLPHPPQGIEARSAEGGDNA